MIIKNETQTSNISRALEIDQTTSLKESREWGETKIKGMPNYLKPLKVLCYSKKIIKKVEDKKDEKICLKSKDKNTNNSQSKLCNSSKVFNLILLFIIIFFSWFWYYYFHDKIWS